MTVTHEPWLVALSLIMAFQGSFVGLSLTVQLKGAVDPRRRQLLAGAALTLALAIWSMHFVGMLAAKFPVPVNYLVLPTLLSFLVCVLVVGIAVFAASNRRLTALRLGLAAFVMGAGICTMHYIGMFALHQSINMQHTPTYVLASFLIAFNASGLSLWLLFGIGRRPPIVVSAAVMSLAIAAMHYTAMAGMSFVPGQIASALDAPALGPGTLAILVSCVAFLVSGLFLLALVPSETSTVSGEPTGDAFPADASGKAETGPEAHTLSNGDVVLAQDSRTKRANDAPARPPTGLQAAASALRQSSNSAKRSLPIERDGQKSRISVDEIVAIHADAHYTRLFDGNRDLFCPLSISEAEQQLDPKIFSRVHRSHIVNLNQVTNFKRSGDGGVLFLSEDGSQTVPVSRSRWARVKSKLMSQLEHNSNNIAPAAAQ